MNQAENITIWKYKPEIDGLRAVAVIAVIINHFNKDILPSGYLGVDIFFVISGYVITSSLTRRIKINFWDFITGFYERRIKRLIPALFVFTLITSLLICFFDNSPLNSIRTGAASLIGLSNVYLGLLSFDYFGRSIELNPFAHTWSLGIEEQFYILYPLIFWFLRSKNKNQRVSNNLILILYIISISSLIGFIYFYQNNQPLAYFLLPTRLWEISAGCLLFLNINKYKNFEQFLVNIPSHYLILSILLIMFLPVSAAIPSTVLIVILSSLLIGSLKNRTRTFKLLSNRYLVRIGVISYSLYLWHWGIISISLWTIGIHWWSIPFQTLLIYTLANLSYEFLEKRTKTLNLNKLKVIIFGLIVSTSGFIFNWKILSNLYLYLGPRPGGTKDPNVASLTVAYPNEKELIPSNFNSKNPSFYFAGDSYVGSSWWYANKVLNKYNFNIYVHPRLEGINHKDPRSGGSLASQQHLYFIKTTLKKYSSQIKKGDFIGVSISSSRKLLPKTREAIEFAVDFAKEKNAKLILFGQIPTYDTTSFVYCTPTWYRPKFSINKNCDKTTNLDEISNTFKPINNYYKMISKENEEVFFYDQTNGICDKKLEICFTKKEGDSLYYDGSHLTDYGAELVGVNFITFFEEILFQE